MSVEASSRVDPVDLGIVSELLRDARISLAELGRRVQLSRPAAAERVRRLEQSGVITGYHARVDLARLGMGLQARVSLRPRYRSGRDADQLREQLLANGHVTSCVHVTGQNCYELSLAVRDARQLEEVVDDLARLGETTTSVVLSELIDSHEVDPTAWR